MDQNIDDEQTITKPTAGKLVGQEVATVSFVVRAMHAAVQDLEWIHPNAVTPDFQGCRARGTISALSQLVVIHAGLPPDGTKETI